jgi:hypothetical protein
VTRPSFDFTLMSSLTRTEKAKLERLFGMSSGYVLDFSNRTFADFLTESVDVDLWDEKYNHASGSKANRLRAIWEKEPNATVAKLIQELLEHLKTARLLMSRPLEPGEQRLFEECATIPARLRSSPDAGASAVLPRPPSEDTNFHLLSRSIKESIERGEPAAALDRLHTFVVRYVRSLCTASGISTDRDKPLHSLFGEYLKHLRDTGQIETTMTDRILKSTISLLEAFNDVRNNRSLAHDNSILSHDESLLILNSVSNSIQFLESVEKARKRKTPPRVEEDVPF